jgi:GNAT superfamily N-acetyltransferase
MCRRDLVRAAPVVGIRHYRPVAILSAPEPLFDEVLIRPAQPGEIAAGEALLVDHGRHPIATLVVAAEDAELWGPDMAPAYYISWLAVARRAGGADLGVRLFDWVAGKAAARGWHYIRLATASNNADLRRYYERAGFRHVGDPPHARWPHEPVRETGEE